MRYLFGFLCVCALGAVPLVGCIESTGDGGSGGVGGEGGTGGMPECEGPEDCDDGKECTTDACTGGACEYTPVADGTACGDDKGACQQGSCQVACTEQGIRDAIAAGGGPYTFDCGSGATVTTLDVIEINNNVILDGEGKLTVDGNEKHGIFFVNEGVTAELIGFTVTRGNTIGGDGDGRGGGIDNTGTLTLTNSTVSGSSSDNGGGIANEGTMTLTNSTVSGNNAELFGGGIFNFQGTITLTNCTVSRNNPGVSGGGIVIIGGTLTLTGSTVSGNLVLARSDTTTLTNSLIDGTCTQENGGATWTSNGYNIESPGDTCGFDQEGDLVNITEGQLDLGELASNGGPTMTHALGADSVAIDQIPAVDCGETTDQRGEPRPEPGGTDCDVGSFERQPEDP